MVLVLLPVATGGSALTSGTGGTGKGAGNLRAKRKVEACKG